MDKETKLFLINKWIESIDTKLQAPFEMYVANNIDKKDKQHKLDTLVEFFNFLYNYNKWIKG